MSYKHVGRIKNNKRKVIVAYRTVPGEPENCIVVTTENLMADEHDTLMRLVESDAGQQANEFAEAMARTQLPDGRNMLSGFHSTGKLMKLLSSSVEMTPDRTTSISLDELNQVIATQRGVSVEDLAISDHKQNKKESDISNKVEDEIAANEVNTPVGDNNVQVDTNVLTDEQLAEKYRKDATVLYREARRLREEAEKLSPSKKRKKTSGKSKNSN